MLKIIMNHKKITGLTAVLLVVCLIPVFMRSPYYLDLFIVSMINAMLAMTFIFMLRTGLINMSLIAFWGVGAYASAILTSNFHLSFWLSLPLSILVTALIAVGVGSFLISSGSGGFAFVMLSSVIGMLFPVLVGNIPYLGGYMGIKNLPPPAPISLPFLPDIVFGPLNKAPYFYLALVLFIIVILAIRAFYSSSVGRAWTAIGLTPRLAESLGINIFRYRLSAFVLSSAICGLAGCFYAHYTYYVIPDVFSMWQNMYVQLYAILGGIGFPILGPIFGALVMTFLPEFLRVTSMIAPMIVGGILVLLVLFLPQGLLSLVIKDNTSNTGNQASTIWGRLREGISLKRYGKGKP